MPPLPPSPPPPQPPSAPAPPPQPPPRPPPPLAPSSPPSPPSFPWAPSPPPLPPPVASLPESGRTGNTSLLIQASIEADLAEVSETSQSIAAFKDNVCRAFAINLHQLEPEMMEMDGKPCFACVTAGQLSPGSINVPITVVLKDSESSASVERLTDKVNTASPQQLFKGSAYESKVSDIKVVSQTLPRFEDPPAPVSPPATSPFGGSSGIDPSVVGPAVAVPGAAVVVVLAAAVIVIMIKKRRRKQPIQYWSSPVFWPPPAELNPQPSPFEPVDRAL
ncbi:hypothetical protein DUNSADRAFT_734 [Dunaliella salina]|uniref:Uncharacterized protein n=1 Tax=Dunaliella salina TaxID=3046 RepID=A0ABQ7GXW9_DUNSA|nr:hypothetical protein DUNSADRAFT_734 [Dunaliella salina]|eukprot:KAF5839449.1 hypothetical protein DUNSADRAFT_734 [Dunaliella salina]